MPLIINYYYSFPDTIHNLVPRHRYYGKELVSEDAPKDDDPG